VQACVKIPLLSLLDVVGAAIRQKGLRTVGLLGTRFTMEKPMYPEALARQGIQVLVPDAADQAFVNEVIYKELVAGIIRPASRDGYVRIINKLAERGAQGIILGCTEIPLLVSEADAGLPLFNTTTLHAEAALEYAMR